jgi:hypothetical protein
MRQLTETSFSRFSAFHHLWGSDLDTAQSYERATSTKHVTGCRDHEGGGGELVEDFIGELMKRYVTLCKFRGYKGSGSCEEMVEMEKRVECKREEVLSCSLSRIVSTSPLPIETMTKAVGESTLPWQKDCISFD